MASLNDFELTDNVTLDDIPAMVDLHLAGWADDRLWQAMMRNVAHEHCFKLTASIHKARIGKQYNLYFKVVEKSTGKIVGWTALLEPQPGASAEEHHKNLSKVKIPSIPGMDARIAKVFFEDIPKQRSLHSEYDPKIHFHRRGTFVHPDYQRCGLGKLMTEHVNRITDEAGCTTMAGARPASKSLFERCGFRVVATLEFPLKADGSEVDVHYSLQRDPPTK